jgi:hypothetical protein
VPLARPSVALRLRHFPAAQIVNCCGDVHLAVEKILELSPQSVFLDVLLPAALRSLEQKPDPSPFLRILRSKIVRSDRSVALSIIDYA